MPAAARYIAAGDPNPPDGGVRDQATCKGEFLLSGMYEDAKASQQASAAQPAAEIELSWVKNAVLRNNRVRHASGKFIPTTLKASHSEDVIHQTEKL